jgi:preprotein translocase subunit YajC
MRAVFTNLMNIDFVSFLAQAAPASGQSGGLGSMLFPMVLMGVIFYFMLIRPQNQRAKELRERISALKTGDKVVTNSGIHGIISNVKDGQTLMLKIADNVKIEINKDAIASVEKTPEKEQPATV